MEKLHDMVNEDDFNLFLDDLKTKKIWFPSLGRLTLGIMIATENYIAVSTLYVEYFSEEQKQIILPVFKNYIQQWRYGS